MREKRRRRRAGFLAAAGAAVVALVLAACSSGGSSSPGGSASGGSPGKLSGTLVVFATSLTDAFDKIGAGFHQANPGVTVKFNYNGSSSLATSVNQGAR
jgi:molybdate transport system substrate-binding protein